jgi:hypothetical protein
MCGRYQDTARLVLQSTAVGASFGAPSDAAEMVQTLQLNVGVVGSPLRLSPDTVGMSFSKSNVSTIPPLLKFHGGKPIVKFVISICLP